MDPNDKKTKINWFYPHSQKKKKKKWFYSKKIVIGLI